MIEDHFPRLGAIDLQKDGRIGAVWIARDPVSDVAHLYDCCLFEREVEAVIAHGLNARGRSTPVAWEKKDKALADMLLDLGCNMLPEPVEENDGVAEVISRNIWQRMRSGRFRVGRSLREWTDEFKGFRRSESQVPREGYPLQAATRYAVTQFDYARPVGSQYGNRPNYPQLPVF